MIKKILLISIAISTLTYSQLSTQISNSQSSQAYSNSFSNDAISSLNNTLQVIKSPLHFDKTDLTLASALVVMTAASFSLDDDIKHDIAKTRSKNLDLITDYGEKFGNPIYSSIFAVLIYANGIYTNNKNHRETGQILIETLLATSIATQGLKHIFGRARPFTGSSPTDIDFLEFEFEKNENSFPSGHTSIAFATATVLSERFDNIFASIALYSMASLTAFQRIYSNVHWFSDTILGAALGTFIGMKIISLHECNQANSKGYKLNLFPQVTSSGYGVGFAFQF